jgi:ferredoxin-NADP reductase
VGSHAPFRLLYSVRSPADVLYPAELAERQRQADGLRIDYVYTRSVPAGWPRPPGRLSAAELPRGDDTPAPPAVFVCGPTGFVEAAANLLIQAGHRPGAIKTERFGPSGG